MILRPVGLLAGVILPLFAAEIPAGQILEVRMENSTGTRLSKVGDPVHAVLISPVIVDGALLVPAGARVAGRVSTVKKFGLGIKRSHAQIGYRFESLRLDGGTEVPIDARLVRVDTARENVDELGQVQGIAPTVSASSALAFYAWRLVVLEPVVGGAVWATKFLFAPAPDPEITYPVGTELLLKTQVAADVSDFEIRLPVQKLPEAERSEFKALAAELPEFRIRRKSGQRGDRINLMFAGEEQDLVNAFQATGWVGADDRSPRSLFRTYLAVEKRQGRPTAPMAPMTYNGSQEDLVFQKSLNTFSRRHHLRLWKTGQTLRGLPVWVGSATEDVHVSFSKDAKRWVHNIDAEIDNERAKVVNDLMFTGCVETAGMVAGAPVDQPEIQTDGRLAVASFTSCAAPRAMPFASLERKPGWIGRAFAALAHDVARTNAMTLGIASARIGPVAKAFLSAQKPAVNARSLLAGQQTAWLAAR